MKTCSKCGEEKELTYFYPQAMGRDGFMAHCKACHYKMARAAPCIKIPYYFRDAQRRRRLKDPEAVLYKAAKQRAKERCLAFTITMADIVIPTICPLLGVVVTPNIMSHEKQNTSPSLDRIDNTKGYISGNVWVISWRANNLKNNATTAELETIAANMRRLHP